MAKQLTRLNIGLEGTYDALAKTFQSGLKELNRFGDGIRSISESIAKYTGIGAAIELGMEGVRKVGEGIREGFDVADQIESASAAMTGLANSAENAEAIIQALKNLSTSKGLDFSVLNDATRKLLSLGVSAEKIPNLLKALGDISVGTGNDLSGMIKLLSYMQEGGDGAARAMQTMSRDGIPLIDALAVHFNTTRRGIEEMAQQGRISGVAMQEAFEEMSGPGGRFFGMLDRQAGTFGGTMQRLGNTASFAFAQIAEKIKTAFDLTGIANKVIAIMPKIAGAIVGGIDMIMPYLRAVGQFISDHRAAITVALVAAGAIAGLSLAFVAAAAAATIASFAISAAMAILAGVGAVIGLIISPLSWVIGGLVAVGYELVKISGIGATVGNFFHEVFSKVYESIAFVFQHTGTLADAWTGIMVEGTYLVQTAWAEAVGVIMDAWSSLKAMAGKIWNAMLTTITDAVYADVTIFLMLWERGAQIWRHIVSGLGDWFSDVMKSITGTADNQTKEWIDHMVAIGRMTEAEGERRKKLVDADAGRYVARKPTSGIDDMGDAETDAALTNLKALYDAKEKALNDAEAAANKGLDAQSAAEKKANAQKVADAKKTAEAARKAWEDSMKKKGGASWADKWKDFMKPIVDANPVITPTLSTDNLGLSITPEIKLSKLLRAGTGAAQLAAYSAHLPTVIPGVDMKGASLAKGQKGQYDIALAANRGLAGVSTAGISPAAIPSRAVPASATGSSSGSNQSSTNIESNIGLMTVIMRKWDSNFPIQNFNF